MSKAKPPKGFKSALKTASKIAKDTQKTANLLTAAAEKANSHRKGLKQAKGDLENLFRMLGAWVKGDYKKIPVSTVVFAISAIVYFLNPFDFVHDYLPGLGYMDDATIIMFVIRSIKKDLEEYLVWEKHTK